MLGNVITEDRGRGLPVGDQRGAFALALGLLHRPHQAGKECEGEIPGGRGLLAEQGK